MNSRGGDALFLKSVYKRIKFVYGAAKQLTASVTNGNRPSLCVWYTRCHSKEAFLMFFIGPVLIGDLSGPSEMRVVKLTRSSISMGPAYARQASASRHRAIVPVKIYFLVL